MLASPQFSTNGFSFTITGIAGQDYLVDASTNLLGGTNWVTLATTNAPTLTFSFTNNSATNLTFRFYRVRQTF